MTENEQFYDTEIAPALLEIGKRLKERGMPFLSVVEYAPGERGSTIFVGENDGLAMQMLRILLLHGENVDGFIFDLKKYCLSRGIDISGSLFLEGIHQ